MKAWYCVCMGILTRRLQAIDNKDECGPWNIVAACVIDAEITGTSTARRVFAWSKLNMSSATAQSLVDQFWSIMSRRPWHEKLRAIMSLEAHEQLRISVELELMRMVQDDADSFVDPCDKASVFMSVI